MIQWAWVAIGVAALALSAIPSDAAAFSFKPAFDAGEQVISITLDSETNNQAAFDTTTDVLTFALPVNTINTTVETLNVGTGTVFLNFQLELDLATLTSFTTGSFEGASASFDAMGFAQLVDAADGSNILWEGSFDGPVSFNAQTNFGLTQADLIGGFTEQGGTADASFLAAIGNSLSFDTQLVFSGSTCTTIVDVCPGATDMINWDAQATTTLVVQTPEPTIPFLVGLALFALGARRRTV